MEAVNLEGDGTAAGGEHVIQEREDCMEGGTSSDQVLPHSQSLSLLGIRLV